MTELRDDAVKRNYAWGPDLSGTLQGAGGIGGLVLAAQYEGYYSPVYDGNGNVMALVNADDPNDVSTYEYGPFGEPLTANGTFAADNPFRFSTKYTDPETGLLYFGYRYYNPSTGRWINRDPIENFAVGGNVRPLMSGETANTKDTFASLLKNLCEYALNSPTNRIDPIGLCDETGICTWRGSIQGSGLNAGAIGISDMRVEAFGVDKCKCTYAIEGTGEGLMGVTNPLGVGSLSLSVSFKDIKAPCMWPINQNDKAVVTGYGLGGTIYIPLFLVYKKGSVGPFFGSGVDSVGGVGWVIGIVDFRAEISNITRVGPTTP